MFCYKCGSAMTDEASACPNCGTLAVTAVASQTPSAQVNPAVTVVSAPPVTSVPGQTEDKAIISLVLGILSLFSLSILAGIPAIILGQMSRKNIRASAGRLTGEGMATAGVVMGWISVVFAVLILLAIIVIITYVASTSH